MSALVPWRSPAQGASDRVGIYDRDYYRREESQRAFSSYVPNGVVAKIIVVNVAVWLADAIVTWAVPQHRYWLSDHLAVHVDTLTQPWLWWEYLTAGFTHSPVDFQHILFNMLVLYFLGRDVEEAYGGKEFLRLYLVMVVFASVVWNVLTKLSGGVDAQAYGASGAIAGVVILYALNFPRRTLLLFFVLPVPAWLCGVLVVVLDMLGALGQAGASNVAYSMHLTGAVFAFVYYRCGWNLTRLTEGHINWPTFRRRPRLRIHRADEQIESDLNAEVDRILEKIYREGEASLSATERKTLETASRQYQRKVKTGSGRETGDR
jgi:membrane associated rhomboid family serine protease